MAGETIFKVLTEFQFETAGAVASAGVLEKATDRVSTAAQGALSSIGRLASYATGALGLSVGGLSILTGAVKASENFTKNQLSFSNIISSNLETLTGDVTTFNDRMMVSEKILKRVAQVASEFSLDEEALLGSTKMLSAMLAPKGLTGKNFERSIGLARTFEKSAPTLGVDTMEAQGQLIRMVEGAASMGDTLFRRLVTETKAMAPLKAQGAGSASKSFNSMDMVKRFELIEQAMGQFASDADVLAGNSMLLSNQLTRLKNMFVGLNSVLKPLGDVVVPKLKIILKAVVDFIDVQGRRMAEALARFIEPLIRNPEQIYITLKQLASLKNDLASAGKTASAIGFASIVFHLGKMALGIGVVRTAVMGLVRVMGGGALLAGLGAIKAAGFAMRNILPIFGLLARAVAFIGRIAFIITFFTVLFQLIERAKAIADVSNAKYLIEQSGSLAAQLVELGMKLKEFVAPLYILFDDLAGAIAPFFEIETYAKGASVAMTLVTQALDFATTGLTGFMGGVYGLGAAMASIAFDLTTNFGKLGSEIGSVFGYIFTSVKTVLANLATIVIDTFGLMMLKVAELFERAKTLNFSGDTSYTSSINQLTARRSGVDPLGGIGAMPQISLATNASKAFDEGANDFFRRAMDRQQNLLVKDKNVVSQTTNIGKVEIRQDFKENQEPDRIAVSLVKTLAAVALNPTQAAGNSLSGSQVFGGVR